MMLAVSFTPAAPETIVAAIVRAEAAGVSLALIDYGTPRLPVDPLAVAAAAAMATDRIRLCVAVSPAIVEPFTFARGLAALDHLSGGRAAWRVVATVEPFGASVEPAQQAEFAEVVTALCESWSADALVDDKGEAAFWRAGGTAPIAHDGVFYQVNGPLNTPRPPQGVPVRVACVGDALAGAAEIVIAMPEEAHLRGEGRGPGGKAPMATTTLTSTALQLDPGLRRGGALGGVKEVLLNVISTRDETQSATGFHARIDPSDDEAIAAFAQRFAGAVA